MTTIRTYAARYTVADLPIDARRGDAGEYRAPANWISLPDGVEGDTVSVALFKGSGVRVYTVEDGIRSWNVPEDIQTIASTTGIGDILIGTGEAPFTTQLAGGSGVVTDPSVVIRPGANKAAEINAAMGGTIRFLEGDYELEDILTFAPNTRLFGAGSGLTRFLCARTSLVGEVEDRTNAMVEGDGIIDTVKLDTVLTTAITPGGVPYFGAGARKVSVVSTGTVDSGDYFTIEGHESGDGMLPGGSYGSAINMCEILRVDSDDAPTATKIPLQSPTKRHHVTTNGGIGQALSVRGLTPLRNVEIRGITFDGNSRYIAVGLRLDRSLDIKLQDVVFRGFTRNAVEMFGCSNVKIDGMLLDGENSGGLYLDSCIDVDVSDFRTSTRVKRYHPDSTKIRSALYVAGDSTRVTVDDFAINNVCCGMWLTSFHDLTVTNGTIDDCDFRPKVNIDNLNHAGIGINMGDLDLTLASFAGPLTLANVLVTNCRADPAMAVQGGVYLSWSVYFHDVYGINASNITVENTGLSPYTTLDGDDDYWMPGFGSQDCSGVVIGLMIKGCEPGFGYHSSQGLRVFSIDILSASRGGGLSPVIAFWFNGTTNAPLLVSGGNIQGGVYFGPDFVPDWDGIVLKEISWDGKLCQGPLKLTKNTTGGVRTHGDSVVFDSDASVRSVVLPGSDGAAKPCFVSMPAINTIADNGLLFVVPANTYFEGAKVAALTKVGEVLETSSGLTAAKVNNASTEHLGRALTEGAVTVVVGPS